MSLHLMGRLGAEVPGLARPTGQEAWHRDLNRTLLPGCGAEQGARRSEAHLAPKPPLPG